MPLRLSVKVGQSVHIDGPATVRVDQKSGQVVGLVFDAERSTSINILEGDETESSPPTPRGGSLGIGFGDHRINPASPGLAPRK